MAGSLSDAMAAVALAFQACSIDGQPLRVFTDPTDVNPPAVFLPPPTLTFTFHKGTAEVEWSAYLVAPNAARQGSQVGWLAGLVDAVAGLFPFTTGQLYTLTPPGGAASWTTYQLTWNARIRIGGNDG